MTGGDNMRRIHTWTFPQTQARIEKQWLMHRIFISRAFLWHQFLFSSARNLGQNQMSFLILGLLAFAVPKTTHNHLASSSNLTRSTAAAFTCIISAVVPSKNAKQAD